MTFVNVVITGNTSRVLARLSELLSPGPLGVFMDEQIGALLQTRARDRFKNEGDDASGKWAPLADATEQIRLAQGYGAAHPINVRTGDLESFIEDSPNRIIMDGQGVTLNFPGTDPTTRVGEKLKGAQQGEGRAPARPVLAINERDAAMAVGALESYIRTGVSLL